MARVLAVGVATLDIVNEVDAYPPEDGEVRALAQTLRRGGNAANTLVVLSQLGHHCEWAGVLTQGPDAAVILADLERCGVGSRYCRQLAQGKVPTSYITLSRSTASRTIVHHRDIPDFDFRMFCGITLQDFDWVHFEGRNIPQTHAMMQRVREKRPGVPVSLEIEKPREGMETLFPCADLILFSQAIPAHYRTTPGELLKDVQTQAPDAVVVCTLGAEGAIALGAAGESMRSDACPPPQLVDTLGAGDVFNAAMVDSQLRGLLLPDALLFACRLAGNKCGQTGFNGLAIPARDVRK